MVHDIISQHIDTYFLVNKADGAYVLLYLPYQSFQALSPEYAVLDAYYIASNKLYHIVKQLLIDLSDYSPNAYNGNLKKLFKDTKCGIPLKSTLIAIPPYGTRVALAIIEIQDKHQQRLPTFEIDNKCLSCNLCNVACPTNALENGFIIDRCLRQCMNVYDKSDAPFTYLQGGILGCEICQKVCPYNKGQTKINMADYSNELHSAIRLDNLLRDASNGKRAMSTLAKYIGQNYNRPRRLLFFALNAIKRKEEAYLAIPFLTSKDILIANKARQVYNQFFCTK